MGVNKEDDDGSGDAWNRNPKPGGLGDFTGPNYIGFSLLIGFIAMLAAILKFG